MFTANLSAQIVEDTPSYRWDKVLTIRLSYSELKCRTNIDTGEKVYQIYSQTSNQFDNFCLTIGDLEGAIQTIEYLINFAETAKKGDSKTVKMANEDVLFFEKRTMLGKAVLDMKLTGNAGLANITSPELNKILKKLNEIARQQ